MSEKKDKTKELKLDPMSQLYFKIKNINDVIKDYTMDLYGATNRTTKKTQSYLSSNLHRRANSTMIGSIKTSETEQAQCYLDSSMKSSVVSRVTTSRNISGLRSRLNRSSIVTARSQSRHQSQLKRRDSQDSTEFYNKSCIYDETTQLKDYDYLDEPDTNIVKATFNIEKQKLFTNRSRLSPLKQMESRLQSKMQSVGLTSYSNHGEFDLQKYDELRERVNTSTLGKKVLLYSILKHSLAVQDQELDRILTDKQIDLQRMNRVYKRIRNHHSMRAQSVRETEQESQNLTYQSEQPFLDKFDLRTYKYELDGSEDSHYQDERRKQMEHKYDVKSYQQESKQKTYKKALTLLNKIDVNKWKKLQEKTTNEQGHEREDNQGKIHKELTITEKQALEFADNLFTYWDKDKTQKVSQDDFIRNMLLFGLIPNESYARALLQLWKQLLNLEQEPKEVYKAQFLSLFTMNKHINGLMIFIMVKLKEKRQQEHLSKIMQERQMQKKPNNQDSSRGQGTIQSSRRISSIMQVKDKKVQQHVTFTRNNNNNLDLPFAAGESNIPSNQPIEAKQLKIKLDSIVEQTHTPITNFYSMKQCHDLLAKYWRGLDPHKTNEVNEHSFCNFLKIHRIIHDKVQFDEMIRYIYSIDDTVRQIQGMVFNYVQYQQLFVRAVILIGAQNCLTMMKHQAREQIQNIPQSLKALDYQRAVIYSTYDKRDMKQKQEGRVMELIEVISDYGKSMKFKMTEVKQECYQEIRRMRQRGQKQSND